MLKLKPLIKLLPKIRKKSGRKFNLAECQFSWVTF